MSLTTRLSLYCITVIGNASAQWEYHLIAIWYNIDDPKKVAFQCFQFVWVSIFSMTSISYLLVMSIETKFLLDTTECTSYQLSGKVYLHLAILSLKSWKKLRLIYFLVALPPTYNLLWINGKCKCWKGFLISSMCILCLNKSLLWYYAATCEILLVKNALLIYAIHQ